MALCMSERRRTGYLEALEVYVARYGVSIRTIKRWAKKKAPLDEPELMAAFWSKTMTQRVPDSIACVEKADELPVVAPPVELLPVGDDEVGVGATQKRLRNAEVLAYRKYETAMQTNDAGEIRAALRNWNDISAQVRTMTKVAREDELARKELISRTVAEAILVEVHQPIMAGMRGMFDDLCRAFAVDRNAENEARWNVLVDVVCERLNKEVFDAVE